MTALRSPLLLAFLAAPVALTQEPPSPLATDTALAALRIPVHSGTSAHAPGYGTWAAGPGYKASFHDGFAFVPELGPTAPENLPLHWRTASVTVGGKPLPVASPPILRTADWRVEMQHPGWREVYDVRQGGVEQSFVVDTGFGDGDLVVAGTVTTPLSCERREGEHGPLLFCDATGRAIVQYGSAFAFDAAGRRTQVATSFDGQSIELTVPAAWLRDAAFPVTIDPLTASLVLNQLSTAAIGSAAVCTDPSGSSSGDTMTAYSRIFSASDHDVFAVVSRGNFQTPIPVFSDLSSGYMENVAVAYVAVPTARWVVAYETGSAGIAAYFHIRGSAILNSGGQAHLTTIGRKPRLGGSSHQSNNYYARLAWSQSSGGIYEVRTALVHAQSGVTSQHREVGNQPASTNYRREAPAIVQTDGSNFGWLIVWQERNLQVPGSRWYVNSSMFSDLGHNGSAIVAISTTEDLTQPQVAGWSPDHVITYIRNNSLATSRLQAQRLDWNSQAPVLYPPRTVTSWIPTIDSVTNTGLAFDATSRAFVAASFLREAAVRPSITGSAHVSRLSLNGAVMNAETLYSVTGRTAVAAHVTYDPLLQVFPAVFATDDTNNSLSGRALTYPLGARSHYGIGCGPALIDCAPPLGGNQLFSVHASQLPPGTWVSLYASFGQGAVPLGPMGLTGCTLWLDPSQIILSTGATAPGQSAFFNLPLPDAPVLTGDLWFQAFYLSWGANPANIQATRGLAVQIR